ncbi:neutral zinc metallopeptidase [Streptomyces sp. SHP 1-2]|uniref:KPN_02809 family neutral zinc metallopeptidase n=1 Tax=Streptomyces sp. SHP 1-2 TaxID=2769489 RepID=UPI00223797AF|nr:neutral zinc metallopeptidase [Streptomyces sp. SHP 1-2]MCW5254507.1 neutral zinc metallopeptidase [Streptomyces sp. SHP 1-2]
MEFRDDVDLDASQVDDRGSSGGGIPGGGLTIGGGLVGVVVLVVALFLGVDPAGLLNGGGSDSTASQPGENLNEKCRKGSDANQSEKCRVVGVVNSIQSYWQGALPEHFQQTYGKAGTTLVSGTWSTGCGRATSAMGPFYCPADRGVYLDLGFFQELEDRFGAKGGPFAQAYVIGHEYGHHVQNLLGTMNRAGRDRTGADSGSVRLELQADCYAGAWAKNAVTTGFFKAPFTDSDIREGLDAAEAIGDDRIQERTQGRVDPESWTHGSSRQRVHWFTTGYTTGSPARCDTFTGAV